MTQQRHAAGHARLHEPGAGDGDGRRRAFRHLLARDGALRVRGRRAALHRRAAVGPLPRSSTSSRSRRGRGAPTSTRSSRHHARVPRRRSRQAAAARRRGRRRAQALPAAAARQRPWPAVAVARPRRRTRRGRRWRRSSDAEKELAELQQRLNTAVAGECQLVLVGGDAGIGKTRLLDELESLARARQIRVLHGRFVEQDRGLPYQGFCEIIQEYFRPEGERQHAAPRTCPTWRRDLVALFPILAEIAEIRSAAGSGAAARRRAARPRPESRTQIFELLARTLTRLAGGRPLVLLLEELHAAEVSHRGARSTSSVASARRPILVVGTIARRRSDRVTRSADDRGLPRRAPFRLARARAAGGRRAPRVPGDAGRRPGMAEGLVRRLYAGSEGNPFFTKELVRSLRRLRRHRRRTPPAPGRSPPRRRSPPTPCRRRSSRRSESGVGGCPTSCASILAVASVLGTTFDVRDLEALAAGARRGRRHRPAGRAGADRGGARVARRRAARSRAAWCTTCSTRACSPRKRRTLHRRFAELLEARHAGRLDRVLPQLVHHCFQGDVPEKTVEYGAAPGPRVPRGVQPRRGDALRHDRRSTFLDDGMGRDRGSRGRGAPAAGAGTAHGGRPRGRAAGGGGGGRGCSSRSAHGPAARGRCCSRPRPRGRRGRPTRRGAGSGAGAADRARGRRHRHARAAAVARRHAGEPARRVRPGATSTSRSPRGSTRAGESAPGDQVPPGGTLVVALANPIVAVEPAADQINEEVEVLANVCETLSRPTRTATSMPGLCERWEVADGATRFRFTLRADVHFSRRARLLTAAGVKESFEAAIRCGRRRCPPRSPPSAACDEYRAGGAAAVDGIVAQRRARARVELAEPLPIYPALLTEGSTAVARPAPARTRAARHGRHGTLPARRPRGATASSSSGTRATGGSRAAAARRHRVPPGAQRRRRSPPASAPASSTSRATSCPRTSRTCSVRRVPARARRGREEEHVLRALQLPERACRAAPAVRRALCRGRACARPRAGGRSAGSPRRRRG